MAIMCKEAANTFLENIDGFEVAFECIKNSDIFVIKKDNPKKIGMTQDRNYQKELILKEFGQDVEIITMMGTALPYSLENGQLDAIIIDFMKGIHINGEKKNTVIDREEYTSYVLLVNKEFKKTKAFKSFISSYNKTLKTLLEDDKKFEKNFLNYTKTKLDKGGIDKWKIKLLYLEEN